MVMVMVMVMVMAMVVVVVVMVKIVQCVRSSGAITSIYGEILVD